MIKCLENILFRGTIDIKAKLLTFVSLWVLFTSSALAQNLRTDSIRVVRQGDQVQLQAVISAEGVKVGRHERIRLIPTLVAPGKRASFRPMDFTGKKLHHQLQRSLPAPGEQEAEVYRWGKHKKQQTFHYASTIPYESWMDQAELVTLQALLDNCGDTLSSKELATPYMPKHHMETRSISAEPWVKETKKTINSNVYYRVNKTDIRNDQANNKDVLDSLHTAFMDNKPKVTDITKITVQGWASPEGSEQHNLWLATERAKSLANLLEKKEDINAELIQLLKSSEDWEGMRKYIDGSTLPHRAELLAIVDNPKLTSDQKMHQIQSRYPADYRTLLADCLPQLRRSNYEIEYIEREYGGGNPIPRQERVFALDRGAFDEEPETYGYQHFNPWLALKTNFLWWAILAPNFEVEAWLDKKRHYSINVEYWNPWYVWHHNSRAYEVQNLGVEGRYWLRGAMPCKTLLTGPFFGVYLMTGKYDLEWHSHGHQGEYVCAGLTAGFTHSIGAHWNMEYSVSAGYLTTNYRSYKGMFSDRHLIWQHNGSANYFGPTKLKISLVYLFDNDVLRRLFHKNRRMTKLIDKKSSLTENVFRMNTHEEWLLQRALEKGGKL